MPAFVRAMAAREFPRRAVWSLSMFVRTATRGVGMRFVASYSPPQPTSSTIQFAPALWKVAIARAVESSKNERGVFPLVR